MRFGPWAAVLAAGIAAGAVTCAAMVVRRRWLWAAGLAGTCAVAAAVAAVASVWRGTGRADATIAAAFIAFGACIGGYALATSSVPLLTSPAPRPIRLSPSPTPDARVRVVLLADEEPRDYDPAAVTEVLRRYDANEVPLPPEVARPLVYFSERSRYHQAFGSPARASVRDIAAALAARLRDEGVAEHVDVAFCDGGPSLPEVVAGLVAQGATRIVVAALTVAWTASFDRALTASDELGLSAAGIELEATDPMWASPHITAMLAQRALAALGGDFDAPGVVLVSEGEPELRDRADRTAAEQTTFFVQRVRSELIGAGFAQDHIRRAWLAWEEPEVTEAVRHLAAVGSRRVVLLPVTFPVETLATITDLRLAAERAADESEAVPTILPAWGDDPAVVETLREAVLAAIERLDAAEG